jgi:multisubunit Na+/H+ antiporter MnhB subunit
VPGGAHPLLAVLVRWLVPGALLTAGHLVWAGSHAPGGAFQAGAMLCGAGTLLILAAAIAPSRLSSAPVRVGLWVGPAIFLAAAAAPLCLGGHLLEYPRGWAKALIFAIELALTVSIAVMLTGFFAAVARLRPPGEAGA